MGFDLSLTSAFAHATLLSMRGAWVGFLRTRYKPVHDIGGSRHARLEAPEVQFQNILRDRFLVDAIAWRKTPAAAPLLAGKRDYVRGILFLLVVHFRMLLQQAYGGAPRPPRTQSGSSHPAVAVREEGVAHGSMRE